MLEATMPSVQPVLKWVGGKTQLISPIRAKFPETFGRYFEPFLGGAAVFFSLHHRPSVLSDTNSRLIEFYTELRDRPKELSQAVRELETEFNGLNGEGRSSWYYEKRDEFNSGLTDKLRLASLFLALNKTAFNGLFRENSAGKFNVPFNQSARKLSFFAEDNFHSASLALQETVLRVSSFESTLDLIEANDVVYFDPPYVPISETANFVDYGTRGFDVTLQEKLVEVAAECSKRGARVVASNSDTEWVVETYRSAGFKIEKVQARRLVAAKASSRKPVYEVIIHNG